MASYTIGNNPTGTHPSYLDGRNVITTVTVESTNVKTADMVQISCLVADMSPTAALAGHDVSVCGDCKHRPSQVRSAKADPTAAATDKIPCYVVVYQAPRSIWQAWANGNVPNMSRFELAQIVKTRPVRLGAYGDPAAMEPATVQTVVAHAKRWTGYTHQWQTRPDLRSACMASVDTPEELAQARAAGWRTFRVVQPGQNTTPDEIVCPASEEAGKRTTCDKCGLCNGSRGPSDRRKSIAILAHGGAINLQIRRKAAL